MPARRLRTQVLLNTPTDIKDRPDTLYCYSADDSQSEETGAGKKVDDTGPEIQVNTSTDIKGPPDTLYCYSADDSQSEETGAGKKVEASGPEIQLNTPTDIKDLTLYYYSGLSFYNIAAIFKRVGNTTCSHNVQTCVHLNTICQRSRNTTHVPDPMRRQLSSSRASTRTWGGRLDRLFRLPPLPLSRTLHTRGCHARANKTPRSQPNQHQELGRNICPER